MARISRTRTKIARLEGLEELDRQTKKLIEAVLRSDGAKQVNIRAAHAAAKIIRQHAPPNKGISRQKGWTPISQTVEVSQSGMPAFVRQNRRKNPAGLWHEHGTAGRTLKSGKSTGRMPASNWWSKGRNRSRSTVRKVLKAGYQDLVNGVARAG